MIIILINSAHVQKDEGNNERAMKDGGGISL